ncbi:uncharacterized membrane protein YjjP (DUF1212 family) [Rhodobium orientis]|uniref:threonine/serine exporter family protein n=1 Tax=Rhodobium orientis TaxID=34017 RepID=UPI0017D3B01B|nr:threonine/serine exporter family protein [Rhodobium orientis]MBB4303920.1 uncharacterized membrane protein YjjP (DUF1212 family) [Rhodobium orientis]
MTTETDPVILRHRDLEQIAMTALEAGRILMETGARCEVVRQGMEKAARGLGASHIHSRIGFASVSLTVTSGAQTITRMISVGHHGVNMRLNHAVRDICRRIEAGTMDRAEALAALSDRLGNTARHPKILNAFAAGLACASFGRLLGADWAAFLPVLVAASAGQAVRLLLTARGVNVFVVTAIVALVASLMAGGLALVAGSAMVAIAMSAAVLMLVPGVPALNAQTDIMQGFPTLGSARFVTVAMVLVFVTVGVALSHVALDGINTDPLAESHGVLHQALFGALAAAGFGVLFNFAPLALLWAGAAGGIALGVRTLGLEVGWPLEAASFVAAAAVALAVECLDLSLGGHHRAGSALALAGCIPMVPGSAATECIGSLMALSARHPALPEATLAIAASSSLQVLFTIGAMGAGLTIVLSLLRRSDFPD